VRSPALLFPQPGVWNAELMGTCKGGLVTCAYEVVRLTGGFAWCHANRRWTSTCPSAADAQSWQCAGVTLNRVLSPIQAALFVVEVRLRPGSRPAPVLRTVLAHLAMLCA